MDKLLNAAKTRLAKLEKLAPFKEGESINALLSKRGISRRDFMKWAGAMTSLLALPASFVPSVAKAAELADRLPVVWLHMAECTGCSESLLRVDAPSVETLIFDYISLEYHETIMAASGWQAEENLHNAIEKYKGNYILMVEGGIPTGATEMYLTIGSHGKTGRENAALACNNAAAIFAIGTCSSYGGIQAARPNPSGAMPLHKVTNKPVINVPGCPPSEKNIVGNLLHFILFGTLPALDNFGRPNGLTGAEFTTCAREEGGLTLASSCKTLETKVRKTATASTKSVVKDLTPSTTAHKSVSTDTQAGRSKQDTAASAVLSQTFGIIWDLLKNR